MTIGLFICRTCSSAVAITAVSCPRCGASLQARSFNAVGAVGGLCVIVAVLAIFLVPFRWLACPLALVGPILLFAGFGRRPQKSALRLATADDAGRLGIAESGFAQRWPSNARLIVGVVVLGMIAFGIAWAAKERYEAFDAAVRARPSLAGEAGSARAVARPGDALDDAAREVLLAASPAFASCLRSGESVTVHITVAPTGGVEDVRAESGRGTNACIASVVRGLAFAPRDARTQYVVDLGARDPGEGP
jgi:hypothetical protein